MLHDAVGAVDGQGSAASDCVSKRLQIDSRGTGETPCCPEFARLEKRWEWCRNELYKWASFCAEHNINPFAELKDHSEEAGRYYDAILLNSGDAEKLGYNEDDLTSLFSEGCNEPGFL